MYATHVPIIAAGMRSSADIFRRGVLFAILSARQRFTLVPTQLEDVEDRGERSPYLFSWKAQSWRELEERHGELHARVLGACGLEAKLTTLCGLHGLGVVKAGFVLQLMGYDIGCIDSRNQRREERPKREFRMDKDTSPAAQARVIARYAESVSGRAQELWDVWCADVADTYYRTPERISEMHTCIVPKQARLSLRPIEPQRISECQIPF